MYRMRSLDVRETDRYKQAAANPTARSLHFNAAMHDPHRLIGQPDDRAQLRPRRLARVVRVSDDARRRGCDPALDPGRRVPIDYRVARGRVRCAPRIRPDTIRPRRRADTGSALDTLDRDGTSVGADRGRGRHDPLPRRSRQSGVRSPVPAADELGIHRPLTKPALRNAIGLRCSAHHRSAWPNMRKREIRTDASNRSSRQFVEALSRGLDVLRVLAHAELPLSNKEIANRTHLPKATVSRITFTLSTLSYCLYNSLTGQYHWTGCHNIGIWLSCQ